MKGFLKPKLILSLVTMVLLAAAIIVPLAGKTIHSHAQGGPTITLSPTSGPPGTVVTVAGSGWGPTPPVGLVCIRFGTSGPCIATATVATNDTFSTTITIPSDVVLGPLTISAFQSEVTVTATFTVTPATPRRQLIIFLQGITTDLNGKQITEQITPTKKGSTTAKGHIVGMGLVPSTVRKVFPNASTLPGSSTWFLEYSYFVSRKDNGIPGPYNCADTISNSLHLDVLLLDEQIKNAFKVEPAGAEVDIYLIGHSLGGAVALTYLDFLEQKLGVALPPHAHLKAVITLDSPIGGVAKGFFSLASLLGQVILEGNCPAVKGQLVASPKDLATVFASTSKTTPPEDSPRGTDPQGAEASSLTTFLGTPLPTPIPSNEDLAERAQTDLGTSFLTIGNENDFLWDQHACARILPSFLPTQFLEDEGDGSGLYGRDFVAGEGTCPGGLVALVNQAAIKAVVNGNHTEVLFDGNVQLGIKNFLKPLVTGNVGGTPSPLAINPYQPTEP